MFVLRSEFLTSQRAGWSLPAEPTSSLVLRSLDEPETVVRFDSFASRSVARAVHGEPYRLLFGVMGTLTARPLYAVSSEWEVSNSAHFAAFEDLQQHLFELRRRHLSGFVFDWLLKRLDREGTYLALGVYDAEEGLRLCDGHPEVLRFAQDHPPATYAATNLPDVRFFQVESPTGVVSET
jgi:hypothetical protein